MDLRREMRSSKGGCEAKALRTLLRSLPKGLAMNRCAVASDLLRSFPYPKKLDVSRHPVLQDQIFGTYCYNHPATYSHRPESELICLLLIAYLYKDGTQNIKTR